MRLFKKTMFGLMMLAAVSGCVFANPVADEVEESAEIAVAEADAPAAEVLTVKQLRGKLLYRKGQSKKLERAAEEKSPELKQKVEDLNQQIRELYVAAEPKLKEIYAIQDDLQKQIDSAKK